MLCWTWYRNGIKLLSMSTWHIPIYPYCQTRAPIKKVMSALLDALPKPAKKVKYFAVDPWGTICEYEYQVSVMAVHLTDML